MRGHSVEREAVVAKKVSLLHISDVHFGCSDDAGTQERVSIAAGGP